MGFTQTVVACALALAVAAPAAAQNVDVTGTWSMMFNSAQGPVPAQMVLKKDGDRVVGSIASDMGEAALEAAVKDKAVTIGFSMQMPNGGGTLNVTMNATVDGDAMKGTFDLGGGGGGGDFTGTREGTGSKDSPKQSQEPSKEPAAKVDVTGSWSVEVTTSTISASPTISLKQDGEKLTGQYVSAQYGSFPLTGTVKGDKIEFAFGMTIEGNSLTVSYAGTVDKDAMKGSVTYGDFAGGTFTASRKK